MNNFDCRAKATLPVPASLGIIASFMQIIRVSIIPVDYKLK